MIYKIMNGLCPDNLRGRLVTKAQISNYPTRNHLDLDTPRQNLEFSKSSFFHSGAKTWNEIPLEIRMSFTITIFQKGTEGIPTKLASFPKHDPWEDQQISKVLLYVNGYFCIVLFLLFFFS